MSASAGVCSERSQNSDVLCRISNSVVGIAWKHSHLSPAGSATLSTENEQLQRKKPGFWASATRLCELDTKSEHWHCTALLPPQSLPSWLGDV